MVIGDTSLANPPALGSRHVFKRADLQDDRCNVNCIKIMRPQIASFHAAQRPCVKQHAAMAATILNTLPPYHTPLQDLNLYHVFHERWTVSRQFHEALARAWRLLERDPADFPVASDPSASALAKADATLVAVTDLLSNA